MSAGRWTRYCDKGHVGYHFGEGTSDFEGEQGPKKCPICQSRKFASVSDDCDEREGPQKTGEITKLVPLKKALYTNKGGKIMNQVKDKSCQEEIRENYQGRMNDLRKLWQAEQEGNEEGVEDLGTFNEYGLCFDYVAAGTFKYQEEGFFRYQLSTGGPGDEFRFFCDAEQKCHRIEYWFLNWFDGAHLVLKEKDEALLMEIFEMFQEVGSTNAAMKAAKE